mmetsp:Transcript_25334/g.86758  ORF Transcript_25334/g.86758 Transcript_25334/m.86758 type:complete len:207 (+) Transcript_25334:909-1529(+)
MCSRPSSCTFPPFFTYSGYAMAQCLFMGSVLSLTAALPRKESFLLVREIPLWLSSKTPTRSSSVGSYTGRSTFMSKLGYTVFFCVLVLNHFSPSLTTQYGSGVSVIVVPPSLLQRSRLSVRVASCDLGAACLPSSRVLTCLKRLSMLSATDISPLGCPPFLSLPAVDTRLRHLGAGVLNPSASLCASLRSRNACPRWSLPSSTPLS